jgi:hypothetical protein
LLAKSVLQAEERIRLPPLSVYPDEFDEDPVLKNRYPEYRQTVVKQQTQKVDQVTLEKKLGGIIPDVTLHVSDRLLIVEIYVTHAVDADKLTKIRELGVSAIEFNFSEMERTVTRTDLYNVLIRGDRQRGRGWGTWLYHRRAAALQEQVNHRWEADKPALLQRWREDARRKHDEAETVRRKELEENERLQHLVRHQQLEKRCDEERKRQGYLPFTTG